MRILVVILLFLLLFTVTPDVPVEVLREETRAPPLSDKFHSILPEPELTQEPIEFTGNYTIYYIFLKLFSLMNTSKFIVPYSVVSSGVTKRNPIQEGTKTLPKEAPLPMVPKEHSPQSISIFVYLLLPLVVVVLVILVLLWLS